MGKPSCFECVHGGITGAEPEVGILGPYLEECKAAALTEEMIDQVDKTSLITKGVKECLTEKELEGVASFCYEEEYAKRCGHFDPVLIEKCGQCGKRMRVPRFSWGLFAEYYGDMPVCSEECKKAFEDEWVGDEED